MASKVYDQLLSRGQLVDDNDILIAGTMLSNGIKKIITRNLRHFGRSKSLEVKTY